MQTIAALNCRKRSRYNDDTWEFLLFKRQKTLPKCCARHEIHTRARDPEKQIAMVQPQTDKSKRHVSSPRHNWMNSDEATKLQHFCETSSKQIYGQDLFEKSDILCSGYLSKRISCETSWTFVCMLFFCSFFFPTFWKNLLDLGHEKKMFTIFFLIMHEQKLFGQASRFQQYTADTLSMFSAEPTLLAPKAAVVTKTTCCCRQGNSQSVATPWNTTYLTP